MTNNDIEDYLDWLRVRGSSPRTISFRREVLSRMDKELPRGLPLANGEELKDWIYREGWAKATKAAYYASARSFFAWATNPLDPRLDFDPTILLPRVRVLRCLPKPVSDAQLAQLLARAAEPYRTWALLAAYQGLRCIEVGDLDREHVTPESLTVAHGKGDKAAILPTHPLVWQAVRDLPPGPVAVTAHGDRATGRYVSYNAAMHFRRIGMAGISMHRLRHWYGTTIYRATKDIRRTQELLRHASPATTAGYTLITDEERTAAIRALPTFTAS